MADEFAKSLRSSRGR